MAPGYVALNPLTKLTVALAASVEATLLAHTWTSLLIFMAAVLLPGLSSRCARGLVRSAVLVSLPIGLSALFIHGFLTANGERSLISAGPLGLTTGGLARGFEVWARVLVYSGAALLFARTATPAQLQHDLERRGLPPRLAYVLTASVSALPTTLRRAKLVWYAQQARGLEARGPLQRISAFPPIVGAILVGALHESEQRALVLEMRGFGASPRRDTLSAPPDSARQGAARLALLCLTGVTLLMSHLLVS